MAKLPIGGSNVPWSGSAPVTACDPKREWLTNQNSVWLPVLTPVTTQAHPPSLWPFHARPHDIPCTRDVGDQDQVEVFEAVDCEPDSSMLSARHPIFKKKIKSKNPDITKGHYGNFTKKLFHVWRGFEWCTALSEVCTLVFQGWIWTWHSCVTKKAIWFSDKRKFWTVMITFSIENENPPLHTKANNIEFLYRLLENRNGFIVAIFSSKSGQ